MTAVQHADMSADIKLYTRPTDLFRDIAILIERIHGAIVAATGRSDRRLVYALQEIVAATIAPCIRPII